MYSIYRQFKELEKKKETFKKQSDALQRLLVFVRYSRENS